jgi:hypothetical protein
VLLQKDAKAVPTGATTLSTMPAVQKEKDGDIKRQKKELKRKER